MPISKGYSAIQRAVVECAYAGCETIWITLAAGQEPLIRDLLGDFVEDPVWYHRQKERYPKEHRKQIPIFYVPVHPKDAGRRDCAAWGIINSAMASYYTSKKISNWLLPTKYYTAFPYGIYDPSIVRKYRNIISSVDKTFYLSHNDRTIGNGEMLGFTFDTNSFVRIRRQFRDLEKSRREAQPRPARFFTFEDVFNIVEPTLTECAEVVDVERYCDISFWNGYVDYMSSPFVGKPSLNILKDGKKRFDLPPIM